MNGRLNLIFALAGTLLLLGDGCGSDPKSVPSGGLSKIVVRQIVEQGAGIPIEGEYTYVRIENPGGDEVAEERLSRDGSTTVRLSQGSYTLISYQRYCDGNCDNLDPPSDRCSSSFAIVGHEPMSATVRVTFGSGCRIDFAP